MIRNFSSRFGRGGNNNNNSNSNSNRRPGRTDDNDDPERRRNIQTYDSDNDSDNGGDDLRRQDSDDDDDDDDDDYTTVTVENNIETETKTKTKTKKPLAAAAAASPGNNSRNNNNNKKSTQVLVGSNTPTRDIKAAINDITKLSVCAKNVTVTRDVASKFLELVRGDNRSWEAIAVDILRQKARWDSIVIDNCCSSSSDSNTSNNNNGDTNNNNNNQGKDDMDKDDDNNNGAVINYLDLILSSIVNVDNCAYLHLSNLTTWSLTTSFAMQSMIFSKSLTKLQLDFIDLSKHVSALAMSLSENKSITCLIASRCGLEDDHLGILLGHLPQRLEELRIFGNKCRTKGLASLTAHLQNTNTTTNKQHRSACRLKILDLSFQHVGPNDERDFDIQWFAEALGGNKTLKVLDLDNDSLDDGHLTHIVAALCRNKTLEELMLNHNKITGTGVAILAAKFGEMKGLRKISMYSNVFDAASTASSTASAAAAAKPTS